MLPRLTLSVVVSCLAGTTAMLAQQGVTVSGQYSTVRLSTDTVNSPRGGAVVHFTYGLVSSSDDPGGVFSEGMGDCVGTTVLADDGTPAAGAGSCFITDMDGDGWWQWWKLDEAGTSDCPIMCGTWGSYNGTGKFADVSVSGTFKGVAAFADGSGRGIVEGRYGRR